MVESITMSTADGSATMTADAFHKRVGAFLGDGEYDGIPADEDFEDGDWLPADDIGEIADRLIQTEARFAHLRDRTLLYFWAREGPEKDGQVVMGTCRKIAGPLKAVAPGADFMVAMSADHWRDHGTTVHQAEAIVNHELRHAGLKKGKPIIVPHTLVGFIEEVPEYGLYSRMLQAAGEAFRQLTLEMAAE